MPYPGDRMPKFIRESNHEKVEAKLSNLAMAMGQKIEVINIYESRQGGVVAWYFQDTKTLGAGNFRTEEETPKSKKKRTRRKAGN